MSGDQREDLHNAGLWHSGLPMGHPRPIPRIGMPVLIYNANGYTHSMHQTVRVSDDPFAGLIVGVDSLDRVTVAAWDHLAQPFTIRGLRFGVEPGGVFCLPS